MYIRTSHPTALFVCTFFIFPSVCYEAVYIQHGHLIVPWASPTRKKPANLHNEPRWLHHDDRCLNDRCTDPLGGSPLTFQLLPSQLACTLQDSSLQCCHRQQHVAVSSVQPRHNYFATEI